jgi:hypothetical protein
MTHDMNLDWLTSADMCAYGDIFHHMQLQDNPNLTHIDAYTYAVRM